MRWKSQYWLLLLLLFPAVHAAEICTDTDGGKNQAVLGTVNRGNVTVSDECLNSTAHMEYYCNEESNTTSISSMLTLGCTACSDGVCTTGEDVRLCTDDDGGFDLSQKGEVLLSQGSLFQYNFTDYCYEWGIIEYECTIDSNGRPNYKSTSTSCATGSTCIDGACVESVAACNDLDGVNQYEDSYVEKGGVIYSDECSNLSTVKEQICSGDFPTAIDITCTGGYCSGGRCVWGEPPNQTLCEDTDGSGAVMTAGRVFYGDEVYVDYCNDNRSVNEYLCAGGGPVTNTHTCPNDYVCTDGACHPPGMQCSDSDGEDPFTYGVANYPGGSKRDFCVGDLLAESVCRDGKGVYLEPTSCPAGNSCWNGTCYECFDTDKESIMDEGKVIYNGEEHSDYCHEGLVVEQVCANGEVAQLSPQSCPSGYECRRGACVDTESSCIDPDGDNRFAKNSVSGNPLNPYYGTTDRCIGNNFESIVEMECRIVDGWDYASFYPVQMCPSGMCRDGACIPDELCTNCTIQNSSTCGDGVCNFDESATSCFTDCSVESDCLSCGTMCRKQLHSENHESNCSFSEVIYSYVLSASGDDPVIDPILEVFDVTDPANISFVGSFPGGSNLNPQRLAVEHDRMYISRKDAIEILDISDPRNIQRLAVINSAGWNEPLAIRNNILFRGNDQDTLIIEDVTNPYNPVFLGSYEGCSGMKDIFIDGDHAFLSCHIQNSVLRVINISDLSNPVFVGRGYSFGNTPQRVVFEDDTSYLSLLSGRLTEHDLSNMTPQPSGLEPYYPVKVTHNSEAFVYDVALHGGEVYVAAGPLVEVFSQGQGAASLRKTSTGSAETIEVLNDIVVVGDGFTGLHLFDTSLQEIGNTPVREVRDVVSLSSRSYECSRSASTSIWEYYSYNISDVECTVTVTGIGSNVTIQAEENAAVCGNWMLEDHGGDFAEIILEGLPQGIYAYRVRGAAETYVTANCSQDSTSPVVILDNVPEATATSVTLSAVVNDYSTLTESCQVCLGLNCTWQDAENVNFTLQSGRCEYAWDISGYPDGTYPVQFSVTDTATNVGYSERANVTLDRSVPNVTAVQTESNVMVGNPATVYARITGEPDNVTFFIHNQQYPMFPENGTLYSAIFEANKSGVIPAYVLALDSANNSDRYNVNITVNEYINWSPRASLLFGATDVSVDLDASKNGNVHVVWSSNHKGNYQVYYAMIGTGGSLENYKTLSSGRFNARYPRIDADDAVHVVWQDDRDGNQEAYYVKLSQYGDLLIEERRVRYNPAPTTDVQVTEHNGAVVAFVENGELFSIELDHSGTPRDLPYSQGTATSYDLAADRLAIERNGRIYVGIRDGLMTDIGPGTDPSIVLNDGVVLAYEHEDVVVQWLDLSHSLIANYSFAGSNPQLSVGDALDIIFFRNGTYFTRFRDRVRVMEPTLLLSGKGRVTSGAVIDDTLEFRTTDFVQEFPQQNTAVMNSSHYEATVSWTTDTLTSGRVQYGINSLEYSLADEMPTTIHSFTLSGLSPLTSYIYQIESSDIYGNTATSSLRSFTTGYGVQRPALPTSVYGLVRFDNSTPAEAVSVNAMWQDTNGEMQTTTATSLTHEEASLLGDPSLAGVYRFNSGRIQAVPGSDIVINAPRADAVTVSASPGGDTLEASDLVVDTSPPVITILSPETSEQSTDVLLQISSNEELASASFTLNGGLPVIFNGSISITATPGENTVQVTAVDLAGLQGTASRSFIVADTVPPIVDVHSHEQVSGTVLLKADVRDTNTLVDCQVCLAYDGNCDTEWQPAVDGFLVDDTAGTCLYNWTTNDEIEGSASYNFRVSDGINTGVGTPVSVRVDNLAPAAVDDLHVAIDEDRLQLSWGPTDALAYNVYRQESEFTRVDALEPYAVVTTPGFQDVGQSEETYHYAVTGFDEIGNENTLVSSIAVTMPDLIPPEIVLESPLPGVYNTTTVPLRYSASETVNCSIGSKPVTNTLAGSEGANNFVLDCSDGHNTAHVDIAFTIDTIPPDAIDVLAVPAGDRIHLSWDSSADVYEVYRSENAFASTSGTPIAVTAQDSFTDRGLESEATYHYAVIGVDEVGNANHDVASIAVTVDDYIPPQVVVESPEPRLYNTLPISVNYTGEGTCQILLDGAETTTVISPAEGEHILQVLCVDDAGNTGKESVSFDVDMGNPEVVTGLGANVEDMVRLSWQPGAATDIRHYNIYRANEPFSDARVATRIGTSTILQYDATLGASEETYHYGVTPVDEYGNENTDVSSITVTMPDTEPPSAVGFTAFSHDDAYMVELSWNASSETDFSHYMLHRNGTSLGTFTDQQSYADSDVVDSAVYLYSLAVVDTSGNERVTEVSVRAADLVPPSITVIQPQGGYASIDVPVDISVDEEATCILAVDGEQLSVTPTIRVLEGEHVLAVTCQDAAGNENTVEASFFTDITPPPPVPVNAQSVYRTAAANVTWNGDADSYKVFRSQQTFNTTTGMEPITVTTNTEYYDVAVNEQEAYHYGVVGIDELGNEQRTVISDEVIIADATPPVVSIERPREQEYRQSTISYAYTVNEPANCTYVLDQQSSVPAPSTGTLGVNDGEHVFTVMCIDAGGNDASASVIFTVELQPPAPVTGIQASPSNDGVRVSWQPNMEEDLDHYNIYHANDSFTSAESATLLEETTVQSYLHAPLPSESTHHYAVTAVDTSGNENPSVNSISVTVVDHEEPPPITGLHVAAADNNAMLLTWDPSPAEDVAYYNIYRNQNSFIDATAAALLGNVEDTMYTDTTVAEGAIYFYAVTAVDTSGNENLSVVAASNQSADVTSPIVDVRPVGRVAGQITLVADVSDAGVGLAESCEVCIGMNCSWIPAVSEFPSGADSGVCSYVWNAMSGNHSYNFRVTDLAGNTRAGSPYTAQVAEIANGSTVAIDLVPGWNLISLPVLPEDTRTESLLASLDYSRVYGYDQGSNKWDIYSRQRTPLDPENTLLNMQVGTSYWIKMDTAGTLQYVGQRVVIERSLYEGWNYVGYPYTEIVSPADAFGDLSGEYYYVYGYDASEERWLFYSEAPSDAKPNTLTMIEPGKGYVIEMKADGSWQP